MPSVEAVGKIYCQLMEEVKARTETVFELASALKEATDDKSNRHNIFVFEGLYLHLRKICELLALSTLAVHNCRDLKNPIGKLNDYAADKLIKAVAKMNPNGFPKPVSVGATDDETKTIFLRDDNFIFDGGDLNELYRICGDLMHVGTLKDVLREKKRELNQDFIIRWCNKLIQGLGTHAIGFPDGERFLFVVMEAPEIPMVTCRLLTRE